MAQGLNRTSVGLKRIRSPGWAHAGLSLNRTSVGLKLFSLLYTLLPRLRLNRTSVGLKRAQLGMVTTTTWWPQSNQRGIETFSERCSADQLPSPQSNQRGIETGLVAAIGVSSFRPQSNQRGIETYWLLKLLFCSLLASIEPAWD